MTAEQTNSDLIVPTGCAHDCGGACVLKAHVVDGRITRFETDSGEDLQLRACVRGRSYRQRVYSPDRLKFPMKRVGERGEGKFERISWDEALDTIVGQLKRV
ncbi:MAG: molybdopterin-dependent oxidoreductase, partial [Dehalococcoidia bacterium]|nr:molybdopterin-dependent oxidoreductase [Dehalococcoidia bacterium]